MIKNFLGSAFLYDDPGIQPPSHPTPDIPAIHVIVYGKDDIRVNIRDGG